MKFIVRVVLLFCRGNRHSFVKYDATAIVSFTSFTGNLKDSPDYINLPYCKRFDLKKENKTETYVCEMFY